MIMDYSIWMDGWMDKNMDKIFFFGFQQIGIETIHHLTTIACQLAQLIQISNLYPNSVMCI